MPSIKISPNHGVNPAIPVCFFCGKPKNQVVLFGKLKGDAKAPDNPVVDLEPCDECRAEMDKGFALLGTLPAPAMEGQPAVGEDEAGRPVYLTGSYAVLSERGVRSLFLGDAADAIVKAKKAFVPQRIVDELGKRSPGAEKEDEA